MNNVKNIRKFRQMTQQELAEKINLTPMSISHIENGMRKLSDKILENLENALQCTRQQLLGLEDWQVLKDAGVVKIKQYNLGAGASANISAINEPSPIQIAFERSMLSNMSRSKIDHLNMIRAEGDSMTPLIKNGDSLLIDRGNTNILKEGVFVFKLLPKGALLVKKLIADELNNKLRIISINPDKEKYPDAEIDLEDAYDMQKMLIIGRVIWHGGTIQ